MPITRRRLLTTGAAASVGIALGADQLTAAASPPGVHPAGHRPGAAAPPLEFASRNMFSRRGPGPLYWNIYGYAFPHNAPIPESEWKANIDWLAREFAPHGYDMACTDGWIEGSTRTTQNGYVTSYNDSWEHGWAYWAKYLARKDMKLGVYYNPLWVHKAAAEDLTKTVIGRPDIKIADLVVDNDFFAKNFGGNTLYWIDVTRPGAKEYVQGYVKHFKRFGVPYLRVDFLSWYENGTEGLSTPANDPHGREAYETALGWINQAAGDDMEVSLVMPHMFENGRVEIANGDMARICRDTFDGGWQWLSGDRQTWQNAWPNWSPPFLGFTGWSHHSGHGQLILDGDFLRASTFASDDERKTMINLMTVAGSPITIADTHEQIADNAWVYTNPELLDLHKDGLVGKPVYNSAEPFSENPTSRDVERWAGTLPDGDWAVALFNQNDTDTVTKTIDFDQDLGIRGPVRVRELWSHKNLGVKTAVSAALAPHASVIYRLSPLTGPIRYPAAYAAWGGGAMFNNNRRGYDGNGFVDFDGDGVGDPLVTFAVKTPRHGEYRIRYRYANGSGRTSTMTVSAEKPNHAVIDRPSRLSFPAQRGWNQWETHTGTIELARGDNLITIGRGRNDKGAINLNWIEVKL